MPAGAPANATRRGENISGIFLYEQDTL